MRWRSSKTTEAEALYFQKSANAVTEMHDALIDPFAGYVADTPEYHSWGLAAGWAFVHGGLDKADGWLGRKRAKAVEALQTRFRHYTVSPELAEEVAKGGPMDQETDKRANRRMFGSVAIREAANGHAQYSAIITLADMAMGARDTVVNGVRDVAAEQGIKGDARKLGKLKQGLLVGTQTLALSPWARPGKSREGWTPGRVVVAAGIIGGTILSGISGFDQIRHLRQALQSTSDSSLPEAMLDPSAFGQVAPDGGAEPEFVSTKPDNFNLQFGEFDQAA